MKSPIKSLARLLKAAVREPILFPHLINKRCCAEEYAHNFVDQIPVSIESVAMPHNPFRDYAQGHKEGHGIWKWEHYFEIYHRHFSKFVGKAVNVLEIGIYSGGSLEMWRSYFGKKSHIYGVDIEDACRAYENEHTTIFIGDQEDRHFWNTFRQNSGEIDILIDDGGHTPDQQQVTLEEMLPYIRPGGVYLCEDIHGHHNGFAAFATGLVNALNVTRDKPGTIFEAEVSPFQQSIHSIHFYPLAIVIEKHAIRPSGLLCPKYGTEWQPFL